MFKYRSNIFFFDNEYGFYKKYLEHDGLESENHYVLKRMYGGLMYMFRNKWDRDRHDFFVSFAKTDLK